MKAKLRPILDGLMILLLPVLMAYSLVGEQLHEWLGILMLLLFAGHHALNWCWHCSLVRGRWSGLRVFQTVMDLALLVLIICMMTGGVLLSSYAFDFLSIRGGKNLGRTLHMLGAYWGLCLISMHAGMHWNRKAAARRGKILLRAGVVLVSIYGIAAFVRRDVGTYMLLKSHFVFFNYEEPLALFLFDYLSIMALFAILGYSLKEVLKRLSSGRRSSQK